MAPKPPTPTGTYTCTPPPSVHLQEITDGTSNTLLLGEIEPKYQEQCCKWDPGYTVSNHMDIWTHIVGTWNGFGGIHGHFNFSTIVPINWPIDDGLSCNYNNWGGNQPIAGVAVPGGEVHAHDNFSVSWGARSK